MPSVDSFSRMFGWGGKFCGIQEKKSVLWPQSMPLGNLFQGQTIQYTVVYSIHCSPPEIPDESAVPLDWSFCWIK